MKYFHNSKEVPNLSPLDGVSLKLLLGLGEQDPFTITEYCIKPGHSIPTHSHNEVQFGFILSGKIRVWIDNEETELKKGDFYFVPPNVLHGSLVIGNQPCAKIDIIFPKREKSLERFKEIMGKK